MAERDVHALLKEQQARADQQAEWAQREAANAVRLEAEFETLRTRLAAADEALGELIHKADCVSSMDDLPMLIEATEVARTARAQWEKSNAE